MASLYFFIAGEPTAKAAVKNMMIKGFVHKFMPKKTRNAIADARSQIIAQLPENFKPLECPLKVEVMIGRTRPKSAPKRIKHPSTRPDIDNYLKLLFDAMNSVVFKDDGQIVKITACKHFSEKPGISVNLEDVEPEEVLVGEKT